MIYVTINIFIITIIIMNANRKKDRGGERERLVGIQLEWK